TKWDDIYSSLPASSAPASSQPFNEMPDLENRESRSETLSEHLLWQLNLTPMSDTDRLIAEILIDALLPSGLLATSCEELHEGFDPELDIELDEIEAVRHRIQQFDPIGVASINLQDCLMVQLAHYPADTPWREQAAMVIHRYLPLLAARDFTQLMRRSRLKEKELGAVIALIRSLNPKPGDAYEENTAEYIVPDVFVAKKEKKWSVELNPDIAPKIQINNHYASMIKRADNSSDNNYLKNNLQEAKWFLKSLHSRNETLLKVATKIIEHQKEFLEHGEEAMKPLILADIAADVEMHESTVSRVTTRKYMHTPRGVFELKYFFSSHVATSEGGECSSTAIRAIIKKLVAAENTRKPLSDNKIANLLDEKGIKVARRTIAKYRESMGIPPSNERKRLA
ncbi:MAG: RNA polymerase factor sigma-54, partial [Pseudomonadales bacterium]|nr:RNA polymerase factor sigma-54 [Pseudomonadales bacterium]